MMMAKKIKKIVKKRNKIDTFLELKNFNLNAFRSSFDCLSEFFTLDITFQNELKMTT